MHDTPTPRPTAAVDRDVVTLQANFFARCQAGPGLAAPISTDEAQRAARIAAELRQLAPDTPAALTQVAARYAVLTLRHHYARDEATFVYPLLLLGGWIWDDLVDHHRGDVTGLDGLIADGMTCIRAVLAGETDFEPAGSKSHPLWPQVQRVATLLAAGRPLLTAQLPAFEPRIGHELGRFFASFADKARLRHDSMPPPAEFLRTRTVCVGMQPCYELSYALKAQARGIGAFQLAEYTRDPRVQRCASLATLHCAAVNDLFSVYKDRKVEDTANLPSVLAPSADLRGYFDGTLTTLQQVRVWYAEFEDACAQLADGPCRGIVVETLQHMMEGNALFHLVVARYAEGLHLMRDLVDERLSSGERYARFARVFGEA